MKPDILAEKIRDLADASGIDALGFADASEFAGYAWPASRRRDPRLSLPEARTIIVAGVYIGGLALAAWADPSVGRTSRLFLSGFFLDVIQPLEPMAALLRREGCKAMICDSSRDVSSILPLKLAAVRAGLGWQGKHSLLISKKFGTFLALGGILTDAELEPNRVEEKNRCRSCDKCQQACPLGALGQDFVLDRPSCLSHLLQTDGLPDKARAAMDNRVMDCEVCQEACPWNAKHLTHPLPTRTTAAFHQRIPGWEAFFSLPRLAQLSEPGYHETLGHLKTTIPYEIFQRNVMLAMGQGR